MRADAFELLVVDAGQLVTVAGAGAKKGADLAELGIVERGFVGVVGERIAAVGPMPSLHGRPGPQVRVIDAAGAAVLPGFVDPHTHIVYGGQRVGEFKLRLQGASYLEIARVGGGILATVQATRAASARELAAAARSRLDRMLVTGTTTAEVKSGYALDTAGELRMLEAVRLLDQSHPVDLVPTFMGAHEVPPEYKGRTDAFVDHVTSEMLPRVAAAGLARFNDVFCEDGVFDVGQSRRILLAGRTLGLRPKLHADEFAVGFGGAELAAEVGAISADHLLEISETGMRRLAESDVTATLLPGTPFCLMLGHYAPARALVEAGCAVALASDCNPGSSPVESMAVVIGLACLQMRLSPAEAIAAATLNAAHAIGLADRVGSLEPGKQADFLVLSEASYEAIPYRFGSNLVRTVVKRGRVVARDGRPVYGGEPDATA